MRVAYLTIINNELRQKKGGSYLRLMQNVFIVLCGFLSTQHSQAQINDSISISSVYASDAIYVFTNRTIDTTREELTFGHEVNNNAGLAILKVTVNETGELVNHLLDYDDFIAQASKNKSDWLLFVHGDSKTYIQSVKRGFDIQNTYNVNVIVFSWPSKNPDLGGLKNLNNSRSNVFKSMGHFNQLLDLIKSFKNLNPAFNENAKLSLLLHSLGNLYLEYLVKNPTNERKFDSLFVNVIMNSAAVDQKKHQEWVQNLNFQERIYITNNKFDFNLKGLHIFSRSGNQLGEKAKEPTAENASYINFTKAVGFRFPTGSTHTYFIGNVPEQSQNIHKFYFDVFHGCQIDLSNDAQFKKRNKGVGNYIIFKQKNNEKFE